MLKKRGLITDNTIKLILHGTTPGLMYTAQKGFIPAKPKSMENLARYIIRASFSQERMNYMVNASKVIYKSKNGNDTKEFDA